MFNFNIILDSDFFFLNFVIRVGGDSFQSPELFDFDHVHFDSSSGSPVAILYGALGTHCFKEFHAALVGAAKQVPFLHFMLMLFVLRVYITCSNLMPCILGKL